MLVQWEAAKYIFVAELMFLSEISGAELLMHFYMGADHFPYITSFNSDLTKVWKDTYSVPTRQIPRLLIGVVGQFICLSPSHIPSIFCIFNLGLATEENSLTREFSFWRVTYLVGINLSRGDTIPNMSLILTAEGHHNSFPTQHEKRKGIKGR